MTRHLIDLEHLGLPCAIGVYLLPDPEPTVIDPGPSTTLGRLEAGLAEHGLALSDLRHVVLTHIHLDHAGATGHLARANPHLRVHVHEDGVSHMADPTKLVSSTRRTFGDAHDRLWGDVLPVPADQLVTNDAPEWRHPAGLRSVPTPGHAGHHLAYWSEADGTFYAGDTLGIVLSETAPCHPPTPPPSLDLATWFDTLEILGDYDPEAVAVTHFGVHGDFHGRRAQLADALAALRDRVARAMEVGDEADADRYQDEVIEALSVYRDEENVRTYFETFPASTDWRGMRFHLERLNRR